MFSPAPTWPPSMVLHPPSGSASYGVVGPGSDEVVLDPNVRYIPNADYKTNAPNLIWVLYAEGSAYCWSTVGGGVVDVQPAIDSSGLSVIREARPPRSAVVLTSFKVDPEGGCTAQSSAKQQ